MGDTLKMKECDTMRILVVEDDRLLNNTLCYNLNTAGYAVDSALTKSAAGSFLTEQDYDLIVLDVNLPDGNGFDFCREVKERRPDTAIIFLTANDMDAIRDLPPYVFVMIGLYAGLRREEILALQWDSVYLDTDTPYLTVRRAWHTEHNRPVISDELKTKAAERNIPLPVCLAECLKAAKETSTSEYVVSNRDGEPLSYTQFKRLWQYIVTRTVKERSYYRYEDGKRVKHTVTPVLGEKAAHNGKVVYSLDFEVTPHQLRHTYITNLIHASVDPKTVQYLAGHESSKITMDIYAKVKYNRPDELVRSMNCAFASWDAAQ